MKTKFILSSLLIFLSTLLFAQKTTQYDVHLKNSSIIRGKIIELTSESVKIELGKNIVSTFAMSDVDKVVPVEFSNSSATKPEKVPFVKKKGFFNDTEVRLLVGSGNGDDKFNTAFSFQSASGYKVNRYFRVGAGVGVDHYNDYGNTFIPVFGRIAGDILPNWITPVYFLDEGYGFMVEKDNSGSGAETTSGKGGWMIHGGIGLKFYTPAKASFTLLAGYHVQKSERDYQYPYYEYGYHEERTYSKLTFGLGVNF